MRAKIPALREALEGRFSEHHSLLIGAILAHLDFLDEQIELLSKAIEAKLAPFGAAAVELLCAIPGIKQRTAENVIAEIGTDMSQFPTAAHLASWAGQCPGNHESAGKAALGPRPQGLEVAQPRPSRWRRAPPRTRTAPTCRPSIAARTQGGHSKALGAVKHSILCAIWQMLSSGEL